MRLSKLLKKFGIGRELKKRAREIERAIASAIEPLEQRMLLTGTWTPITNAAPGASTMLLLTDGTVMVQAGTQSANWNKLTPDASGSYVNGTWSSMASSAVGRLYYASAVLPDGRVLVVGGEYSSAGGWTNTGEIYNPLSNSWSNITPYPRTTGGDIMSEVLNDGTVLFQYINTGETFLYTPATDTWTSNATMLHGDIGSEESWVKLADGSILNYEIWNSPPHGQRWIPGATHAQDQWIDAGVVPVEIDAGAEIGGSFLLNDGRAIFLGANGKTAIYTPPATLMGTGSWVEGPEIRNSAGTLKGIWDGPGAILPNGKLLFPAGSTTGYYGSVDMFEFDPVTNAITQVPSTALSLGGPVFDTRTLVLPSGQVLFQDNAHQLWFYNEDAAPLAAGKPTVTSIVANGTGFTLTGTQLNGISEGAGYGDDAQMASNYPIVRLTSGFGTVSWGRTFNWSSSWVQTGATPITTQFTDTVNPGAYLLAVIANGNASDNTLFVEMGSGANNITIRIDPTDSTQVQVMQTGNILLGEFAKASFTQIIVAGDSTNSTVTVDMTNGNPIPAGGMRYDGDGGTDGLNITGTSGNDVVTLTGTTVTVNSSVITYSNLEQFQVNLDGGTADRLNVTGTNGNDVVAITGTTVTVNGVSITYSGLEQFQFDGLAGNDSVTASGVTIAMTLNGGSGDDTLQSGGGNDSLFGDGGNDTYVFSGSASLGTDTVNEGANVETDTLDFSAYLAAINLNISLTSTQVVTTSLLSLILTQSTGIERVFASTGTYADTITGNSRNNTISGGAGNDSIIGAAGADLLQGDGGNDTLRGDNSFAGTNYRDTLYGGSENDVLYGDSYGSYGAGYGLELDTLYGDAGNDTIYGDAGDGYGGAADLIEGGAGNDSLVGEGGDDTYVFAGSSDLGTDTVNDNSSSSLGDLLEFSSFGTGATVNLSITTDQTVSTILHLVLMSATSIERVNGSAFADTITGNTLNNTIQGNAGGDLIWGGAGNDSLSGGAGNDWIFAQAGNDTIHGDADNDAAYGGLGNDFVYGDDNDDGVHGGDQLEQADGNDVLSGGNGKDRADYQFDTHNLTLTLDGVANDGESGETDNILTDVEDIWGGSGADNITGNSGANELRGSSGADVISGGAGNDTIRGGFGNDNLLGEADNDSIFGDDGDDIITGGSGNDTMNGGMGADHFFAADGFIDVIDGGAGDGVADILESSDGNDVLLNMP